MRGSPYPLEPRAHHRAVPSKTDATIYADQSGCEMEEGTLPSHVLGNHFYSIAGGFIACIVAPEQSKGQMEGRQR